MKELILLIPLLPLAGALVNTVVGMRLAPRWRGLIAVMAVAGSFAATCLAWSSAGAETVVRLGSWFALEGLNVDFALLFDPLAAGMTLMVTGVSTLIHIYAVGYMEKEQDTARFFALLNLFVFAMLCIVLADNLLLLFLGWEGVGFCSYSLIGFWYRDLDNARAGRKAFLVTRVGDVFLTVALLWLFALTGSLSIDAINSAAPGLAPAAVTGIVLLLLAGACGKSAQLPLMTWLPDAMAGPTPVSALIHAATMVTAGVYLLCRLFPLVSLSATGMTVIALVGGLTALYAATCALAQREIKKVLAYSTMSQIGYMFIGVGAGSASGAMFHLLTHAFFKALLFMGAGCIIHLCNEENDIHRMGGLKKEAPFVFWMFLAGSLCLAGLPFSGGFFSKDGILLACFSHAEPLYRLTWSIGLVTAFLTSLYTFRLVYLVFAGEPRQKRHAHRLPASMLWTLPPLAVLGLFGGLLNLPGAWGGREALRHYLRLAAEHLPEVPHDTEYALTVVAAGLFALGLLAAWGLYHRYPGDRPGPVKNFLLKGWRADTCIDWAVVKPFGALGTFFGLGLDQTVIEGGLHMLADGSHGQGERLRRMTSGRISTYLQGFAWGVLAMLLWFLLELARK